MSKKPNIKNVGLKFSGSLTPINKSRIRKIVDHHMAHVSWDINDVHNFHRGTRGWSGIGYNWWIGFDGQIYQARGWNVGAHVGGHNSTTLGIGYQGDFTKQDMTDAQVVSGALLHAYLLGELSQLKSSDIIGHKDLANTACPGKNFRRNDLRNLLNGGSLEYKEDVKTGGEQAVAPKPKPTPAANTSLFRNGSKGSDVKALQERLIKLGYTLPKFGADSHFGDETEAAVRAFQKDQGISVDGIAGPDTFNRLANAKKKEVSKPAPKPQPAKKKYTLPNGVLRRGSKGNDVRQLQTALNAANFRVGTVDGDYGPKTQDAVRRFQLVHLPSEVDGVYGPNTLRALDKVVN